MPIPLDPATLPASALALRNQLLQREAAHEGPKKQVLRYEQLELRLARLLHERFGASSEKLRGAIEQLDLMLSEREEQIAETAPQPRKRAIRATSGPPGASLRRYHAKWRTITPLEPAPNAAVRYVRWGRCHRHAGPRT